VRSPAILACEKRKVDAAYAEMALRRLCQRGISWPTQPPATPADTGFPPRPVVTVPARAATERREPRGGASGTGEGSDAKRRLTIIMPDGTEVRP